MQRKFFCMLACVQLKKGKVKKWRFLMSKQEI